MTNNFWQSEKITLDSYPRGFHLITQQVESAIPSIRHVEVGLLHLWLQHTSASLTINENADPTVRHDMEAFFNHSVKEELSFFRHTYEGKDDMPAHLKSSILGCQLTIPVQAVVMLLKFNLKVFKRPLIAKQSNTDSKYRNKL